MVVTAPASPSSLAGPSAQGRSASRIASDRQGATEVSPENPAFEQLARAGGTCIGRARLHRRDAHRARRRFSGQTRNGRYCRARYYHPQLQRFISEDPIEFAGGDVNLYAYAGNNPVTFADPFGLRIEWGNYVLQNPHVRANLERLNQEIINQGRADADFVLRVTGGDRYIDAAGNIRSATTGEIVPGASPTSPHLVERGARAVDLRVTGVPDAMFDRALRNTEFSPQLTRRDYADRHTHISLPNLPRYYFTPQASQPPPTLSGRKPQ